MDRRPPLKERKFVSEEVERVIEELEQKLDNEELFSLFRNCYPNTLDTTIEYFEDSERFPSSFVITGDIKAMWLRDSCNQLFTYSALLKRDTRLQKLFLGLIRTQAIVVQKHPYSNAFRNPMVELIEPLEENVWANDDRVMPPTPPLVWEAKWELDSLAAFLKLSRVYHDETGDVSYFITREWLSAIKMVLRVIRLQQRGTTEATNDEDYTFSRITRSCTETLYSEGLTAPAMRCGLIKSAFRPSDDATTFPFLIPSNAMMEVELRNTVRLLSSLTKEKNESTGECEELRGECLRLADELREAIYRHVTEMWQIFAYEVDGHGSHHLMDDANVPSLLSLPYIGFISREDPLYQRTRRYILSQHNPYHFRGQFAQGVGSPHTGANRVRPRGRDGEIEDIIDILKRCTAGTGLMHESFHVDDPREFTRSWFSWANGLFGELILHHHASSSWGIQVE
ncbi:hypothetical protein PROFUN_14305 [Planoprotostelium fungivorum]|uniref:Uncharacterized protein n=1 Tax=Planoprotostelium fungivorum TaxID=1890364 RepID=A0A2P6N0K2_9EUKA|nr:hypothetical protein PROFUN_14305 [Planoprotostelium fungivorum]